MVSSASVGYGTLLKRGGTNVPEVVNVSGPGMSRDNVDISNMDSPSRYKEWLAGMVDGGEISAEINYIPTHTVHKALISDLAATSAQTWTLVWSGNTNFSWTCSGWVVGFEPRAEHDGKVSATVRIKIAGAVTTPS